VGSPCRVHLQPTCSSPGRSHRRTPAPLPLPRRFLLHGRAFKAPARTHPALPRPFPSRRTEPHHHSWRPPVNPRPTAMPSSPLPPSTL
jgi:hypothetical protein